MRTILMTVLIVIWCIPASAGISLPFRYDDDEFVKFHLEHSILDEYFRIKSPQNAAILMLEHIERLGVDSNSVSTGNFNNDQGMFWISSNSIKISKLKRYTTTELSNAISDDRGSDQVMGIISFTRPPSLIETISLLRMGVKLFPSENNPRSILFCLTDYDTMRDILELEYIDFIGKIQPE